MLSLQAIRIFVEVSQRKSFSEAGRHLGLSPGAISRQIATLESELSVQLVNRSSRNLSLTEAGRAICAGLQVVVDDVKSVEQLASEIQKTPAGRLSVHSRVTFGLHCVIPALPKFLARYPDIHLDLRLSDNEINLLEDNVEIDIRVGSPRDSTDIVRKVAPSHPILCASPDYIVTHGSPSLPQDLTTHNCLVYQEIDSPIRWTVTREADGFEEKICVGGSVQSNSGEALRHLALAGVGIALIGEWAIRQDIKAGTLVPLLPGYNVARADYNSGIYVVFRQKHNLPLKIRAFIDFLSETLTHGDHAF